MNLLVVTDSSLRYKLFSTHSAEVWEVSGVPAEMALQTAYPREPLVAYGTAIMLVRVCLTKPAQLG